MKKGMLLIVLLQLAGAQETPASSLAAPGEVPVAVIRGQGGRAPEALVLAELEVALSQQEGVALVERSEIDKILQEQELAVSGLTEPRTAARLGKLLSAELLLFVEKVPGAQPPGYRLQVAETATGVTFAARVVKAERLAGTAKPAQDLLSGALAKVRVPVDKRHYVGLIDFRNEELHRHLDRLANAFGMFVTADLSRSPDVVVLDREHLHKMTTEKNLTGVELELKTLTVLLECGLRHAATEGQLIVNISLRRMAGGRAHQEAVTVPARDIETARRRVAHTVLLRLQAQPLKDVATSPKQEAAMFLNLVQVFKDRADHRSALRAAEAAYALRPDQETRQTVIDACVDLAHGTSEPDVIVNTQQRAVGMVEEMYAHHIREARRTEGNDIGFLLPVFVPGIRLKDVPSRAKEAAEIRDRVSKIANSAFRFMLEFYRKQCNAAAGQDAYWNTWATAVRALGYGFPRGAEDKAKLMREFVHAVNTVPGDPSRKFVALRDLLTWPKTLGSRPPEREVSLPVYREMTGNKDPLVRMIGYQGLAMADEGALAAARGILDIFTKELAPGHPYRPPGQDDTYAAVIFTATEVLRTNAPDELYRYCEGIARSWLEKGETNLIVTWQGFLRGWLEGLAKEGRPTEADQITERALQLLAEDTNDRGRYRLLKERLHKFLSRARASYAQGAGGRASASVAKYSLKRLKLNVRPFYSANASGNYNSVHVRGDEFCVLERDGGRCIVRACSLPDGAAKRVVGALPRGWRPLCADSGSDPIWVSDGVELISVSMTDGETRTYRAKDGFPSGDIRRLARLNGRVYVAFGSSVRGKAGLAWFDPRDGSSAVLASSAALKPRHPLDGGSYYLVTDLLADQTRQCLWISVRGMFKTPYLRNGLWRYVPATGKFQHVLRTPGGQSPEALTWSGASLLLWGQGLGLIALNPDSLARVWLATSMSMRSPLFKGLPRFGKISRVHIWPAYYDGECLLTGDRSSRTKRGKLGKYYWTDLYLHTAGTPSQVITTTPDGEPISQLRILKETPHGILAGTHMGEWFLIQRRESSSE